MAKQLKRNNQKGMFEHNIGFTSKQGDTDNVFVKTPKFKLTKKEACKLVDKKRKGTGIKCKKVFRDEITGVPF